jgi:peptidoglycan-associated lipoprotein
MQKTLGIGMAAILLSLVVLLAVSCQKQTVAVDDGMNSTAPDSGYQTSSADQSSMGEGNLHSASADRKEDSDVVLKKEIYFEFDKATLTPQAREILTKNGQWLRIHPDVVITIEGHCDERGTNEYNLALGDRRAESVKTFLADLGVLRSRMTTISYGEERPIDRGHGDAAWARNRRAYFLIK